MGIKRAGKGCILNGRQVPTGSITVPSSLTNEIVKPYWTDVVQMKAQRAPTGLLFRIRSLRRPKPFAVGHQKQGCI